LLLPKVKCCSVHWTTYAEGAKAADDLLVEVFGLMPAHKDDRNIFTRRGFESVLRDITRELILLTRPADEKALRECLRALDNNWRGMSPSARDEAIERAARALGGVPQVVLTPVTQALSRMGVQTVTQAKQGAVALYDLPIRGAFDVVDQRVVDHAATSQALFVRDEYGRRVEVASARAREIVSRGVERGIDRHDMGAQLGAEMARLSVRRSESYFENVASIFAARARSWGTVAAFEEAGISEMEVSCSLDSVSCNACRFMDGQVFSTGAAVSRFKQVAASDDPEAVRELQPFLGVGRNDAGEQAIYYRKGESRVGVAQIVESAVGRDNERGSFSKEMGRGALEASGITAPPYHGRCRCNLVPSAKGLVQVPVQVASGPVEQVPPAQFLTAFNAAFPKGSEFANHVNHYTEGELAAMRCLTMDGDKAGVAVHDHGDGRVEATALFNNGGPKGAGLAVLAHAIENHGVNYVECYGPVLNQLYAKLGFEVDQAFAFDPKMAAPGWDERRFDQPDYVTMRLRHKPS
jgi:hypothetical protein